LRDEAESLTQELREEESKKFECLVDARNTYIGGRLQQDKKKHLPSSVQLPVHFVSSTQYAAHKQVAEPEGPRLEIESTGIPGLRSYALCLATPEIWKAHEEHLMSKVKFLFHGANSWAQDWGPDAFKGLGLIEELSSVRNLWEANKSNTIQKMLANFDTGIIQSMRTSHGESVAGAMRFYAIVLEKPWWHNSFLAFFRKQGKHSTSLGAHSWNERFIKSQTQDVVEPAWEALPLPDMYLEIAIASLTSAIENIPEQLARMPGSVSLPMSILQEILNSQVTSIKAAHLRVKTEYQESLANIKLDATLDQHTGHFTKAMKLCYVKGNLETGPGTCQRIKDCIVDHFQNHDPVGKATDLLAKALIKNTHHHAHVLDDFVLTVLDGIEQQFKMILDRGAETAEEKKARREIKAFLYFAMPDIDRIERDLAKIRQKHSEL
jgi:hypothetical protein